MPNCQRKTILSRDGDQSRMFYIILILLYVVGNRFIDQIFVKKKKHLIYLDTYYS